MFQMQRLIHALESFNSHLFEDLLLSRQPLVHLQQLVPRLVGQLNLEIDIWRDNLSLCLLPHL